MRKRIRLTESGLRRIVSESVRKVLMEVRALEFNDEDFPSGEGIIRGDHRIGEYMPTDRDEQIKYDWRDIDNHFLTQRDFDTAGEDGLDPMFYENENIYDYEPGRYITDGYWSEYEGSE